MPHALLFDLDGTLIESDTLHREVFAEMFAPLGIVVDVAFYNANIQGRHNPDIFAEFMHGEDPHRLSDEKEERFRALLGTSVPEMPGLTGLLDRARALGWRTAVVTNAPPDNAEFMLAAIGKHGAFDTVVVAADCRASKPDPAPYIEAMARLGARPEDCVAFEDSRAGLAAARGSGAYVVGMRSSLDDVTLRAAGANLSITDFNDPALEPALVRLKGVAA